MARGCVLIVEDDGAIRRGLVDALRFAGYATAEAWILGSLLIGFTLYQLRILKKLRFTRAES